MDDYCRFHLFKGDDGRLISNHTMRNCREFDQMAMDYMMKIRRVAPSTAQPVPAAAPPPQPVLALLPPPQHSAGSQVAGAIHHIAQVAEDQYPKPQGQMYMIQKGRPSNRQQKLHTRHVNMAVMAPPAVPEYLRGSETPITFTREDHPPSVYRPGHAALVLDAQIGGYAMTKVFMDGGSGINIIFADTLRGMNRSIENLPKSTNTFHGIVPGKAQYNSTLRSATQATSGQSR